MGEAEIRLEGQVLRYRFGTRVADYLICAVCGVYAGAVNRVDGRDYVTLNLNLFDDPRFDLPTSPVDYNGETAAAKVERRRRLWTPVRLIEL